MDTIELQEARILRVQTGDVVVFETDDRMTVDTAKSIKAQLAKILAEAGHDTPIVVVSDGATLAVARHEDE